MFNIVIENAQNQDEPEHYKSMSKQQIFKTAIVQGKLPPDIDARCTSKAYCIDLLENRVYSVQRVELLMFEARLSSAETQRSAFYSIGSIKPKLDSLLKMKGNLRIGF